jgi:hypothetical protein
MMTDIAHRVEADIRTLCERIHADDSPGGGAPNSAPAPTVNGGIAPAGSAAAVGPRLSDSGLDLALLQRLAASGALDSPTSSGSEHDGGGGGAAAAAADEGGHAVDGPAAAGLAAVAPAAAQGLEAVGGMAGGGADGAAAPAPAAQAPGDGEGARRRRRSAGGGAAGREQVEDSSSDFRWLGNGGDSGNGAGGGAGGSGSAATMGPPPAKRACCEPHCCGAGDGAAGERACSIARQAQVALTTWEHLITSASTPSTVMARPPSARTTTHMTESSAA